MKRFEIIKEEIDIIFENITNPYNRSLCKLHHKKVLENIQKLTDNECLYVAAYMHDISTYLGILGKHAFQSAKYAKEFLNQYDLFNEDEINFIYEVIKVHSDKDKVHFEEAELLKKADIDSTF